MMKDYASVFLGREPVLYGKGRFQRDFEYVFDDLPVKEYIVDEEDESTDDNVHGGDNLSDT